MKLFKRNEIVGVGIAKRISDDMQIPPHLGVVTQDNNGNEITVVQIFTHADGGVPLNKEKFINFDPDVFDDETKLSMAKFAAKTKSLRKKGGFYEI
jgi:hypothetical protein